MDRTSTRSKVQKAIIISLVLLVAYMAFTDRHGTFSMPGGVGHAINRVERDFGNAAAYVAGSADRKNQEMQQVHDNYEARQGERIKENGGEAP